MLSNEKTLVMAEKKNRMKLRAEKDATKKKVENCQE
jgi:hypothetical protein